MSRIDDRINEVIEIAVRAHRSDLIAAQQAGRRAAAAAGRRGFGGSPPYGYTTMGHGVVVPDPFEQEGLALMRTLRDAGGSLRTIAAALEDRGYPPRRGYKWHPTVINTILKQAMTAGPRSSLPPAGSPDAPGSQGTAPELPRGSLVEPGAPNLPNKETPNDR